MVAFSMLERNPAEVELVDGFGHHSISAERSKNGKVWLTCQCRMSIAEGWCRHRVDLICQRYDALVDGTAKMRRALEQILGGTALASEGRNVDSALRAFNECLQAFDKRRPEQIIGRNLGKFADLASDLAACAGELDDAIENLRRLLERS
jgi:hypothetical protein